MDDRDLEEGELLSDEEQGSEFSVDYVILPRPVRAGGRAEAPGSEASTLRPSSLEEEGPAFMDKSASSSDSSDLDSGSSKWKWRKTRKTGPSKESAMDVSAEGNNDFNTKATSFQAKRKPNNVWSSVLQDEEASDILGKVKVEEDGGEHILIERGPETFTVRPPARVRLDSSSSSLSSGGLRDEEYERLRSTSLRHVKDGEGKPCVETSRKRSLKRKHGLNARELESWTQAKATHIAEMKGKNALELGFYMAEKLEESKHELLVRTVELLGESTVIKVFLKTLKIERRGGLLVQNKDRRRSAGGVFFYLLKKDKRIPKKTVSKIFVNDKKEQKSSI